MADKILYGRRYTRDDFDNVTKTGPEQKTGKSRNTFYAKKDNEYFLLNQDFIVVAIAQSAAEIIKEAEEYNYSGGIKHRYTRFMIEKYNKGRCSSEENNAIFESYKFNVKNICKKCKCTLYKCTCEKDNQNEND